MPSRLISGALLATLLVPTGAPALAAPAPAAGRAAATTTLTVHAAGCEGCEITAHSALTSDDDDVWQSKEVEVVDGEATFRVPTDRTAGLSLSLTAPWERRLGYVTVVAMRYAGTRPGDTVGYRDARTERRASACWGGTTEQSFDMTIRTRKVRVDGVAPGKVPGTLAWARTTPEWLAPMRRVFNGVMGEQDIDFCEPPAEG
ncbi:hypothetical protein [Nocardioides hwasunensis]|uniref:Uncharacterized protein n=1 Tax=Nocardioides hwasunensis TaxID=397258 RepID=A0ABR8MK68_9ACTN|nr:hypothetical protein [Nocardioides hwasunensis]MBD3914894.1 hypothetical protein [Nocardioides hwasunensis]